MPRYASSNDVARLAGVSQSAVSRAYQPATRISAETQQRIFAAAEQLGYSPSRIPQIMRDHRSYLVAVVVGELYNPTYWMLIEQFVEKLQAVGHQVLLKNVGNGHFLDAAIPELASYRVDAIVSTLPVLSPRSADDLARFKLPVVLFNNWVMNEWVSSVSCDNQNSSREIAELFAAEGARRVAFIAGPEASPASNERLAAFRNRLEELNLAPPRVATGNFRYEGGQLAALELIANAANRPDAIFCANDLMALGAIDALRKTAGLRAPDDLIVAGFDDIPAAAWYDLTTVAQGAANMVDEAVRMITVDEHHPGATGRHVVVPARLVQRLTTERRGMARARAGSLGGSPRQDHDIDAQGNPR
jgi:DNA-binding LacI/PurR family transcriptional regulator